MDSSTIAKLIGVFNVTAIFIVACLAAAGVLFVVLKVFRFNVLRRFGRVNVIVKAFCAAALAAFALEATAFNFPHYLKYFAEGPPIGITGVSEDAPDILQTTDGTQAELTEDGIRYNDINRRVTSIYVGINFNDAETVEGLVKWTDEATTQQYTKRFYKYLPHENYALLQSCGKVSELTVTFGGMAGPSIDIVDIVINKPIPFYFSGLRLLVVSLLFFALFALVHKNLRAKAAYYLFEYKFDPKDKKQNAVYAGTVALLILFSWVCAYTSVSSRSRDGVNNSQYNRFLVDALISGRTYLDHGDPEILFKLEHPYNPHWRREAYGRLDSEVNDWVWYKGRYYCYFGVVPAVVLYVPYKAVTGNYLSNHAGIFLFCAISVILLAALWRHCVRMYMPGIRYAFYLLSFLTLFFASGWCMILRFPYFYSIVQSAGFMFTVAGVLLLLKSAGGGRIKRLPLFFGCLCFALVFGCRPNMGLASLFVPVVLWKYRSWRLLPFVALPYILVAAPLCVYNYVRFESIFEFGRNYCLTWYDLTGYNTQNPIGKIFRTFISLVCYLFYPNALSLRFPFVDTQMVSSGSLYVALGCLTVAERGSAIINFPIVFCLFLIFKNICAKDKPKTFNLLYLSLIIAIFIMFLDSLASGFVGRYALDMSAFIILPSLFCAYYWMATKQSVLPSQIRMKITYSLCAVSILIGLFLFVDPKPSIHFDPALQRYLEYSLGVIRDA